MATDRQIQVAFEKGASLITNQVTLSQLRAALRSRDIESVLRAVNITDSAWDEFRNLLVQSYADGAISEIDGMAYSVKPRWNSATSQSERYAREVIGQSITRITEDSRQAVRATVADGLAFGRSIDRIASDIVGRREGSNRVGGVVGLNRQQSVWVQNMRRWLESEPANALEYTRRDRRFDSVILEAIKQGKGLTKSQIDRISAAYSARLLSLRGQTIARTERQSATNAGRQEAWRQAAEKLGLPLQAIKKTWIHSTRKMEPRTFHLEAGRTKQSVQGLDTPFIVGGYSCLFPHDPSLPASEVVNCSCSVRYSINRNWRNG